MSRSKNDPQAAREFSDALTKARSFLNGAETAIGSHDSLAASDYLLGGAEALGMALGHIHYIDQVSPETLGQYRGQRDRLEAMKRTFRARLLDPAAELRFNPDKRQRQLKRNLL